MTCSGWSYIASHITNCRPACSPLEEILLLDVLSAVLSMTVVTELQHPGKMGCWRFVLVQRAFHFCV